MQIGDYTVERELARGGMGVVFLARDPAGEQVAVKLLLTTGANPEQLERFRREARALAALEHPGVLGIREYAVDRGRPILVMDYLPGQTLKDLVNAVGPLAPSRALAFASAIAAALVHAHRRGIVHRDLKPANVILHKGRPVLVDFGLALALDPTASRLTETGTIMGSPSFMAPEQAQGTTQVGPSADIYALGATLYFLLTGKAPFEGRSVLAILKKVTGELPRPPRELRPDLDHALEALVLRCLEKDPGDRFPTAFALEAELNRINASEPQDKPAEPEAPPSTRLVVTAVLAALALGGLGVAVSTREPTAAGGGSGRARSVRVETSTVPSTSTAPSTSKGARRTARLKAALAQLKRMAELDVSDADALLKRGELNFELGRTQEALADFDRVIALEPTNADAFSRRGTAKVVLQRQHEALADFSRAIELEPVNAKHWFERGKLRVQLRDVRESRVDFEKAILLDPDHVDTYVLRGRLEASLGRTAEALEDFERAIRIDPKRVDAYTSRGDLFTRQGHHGEALTEYTRALELAPNLTDARTGLATLHAERGETAEAIAVLDHAIALEPKRASLYLSRAALQSRAEVARPVEALRDVRKALSLGLPSDHVAEARHLAERLQADLRAVFGELSEDLAHNPDDLGALEQRIEVATVLKDFRVALQDAERLAELRPEVEQLLLLAGLQARAGAFDETVSTLEKVLAVEPTSAEALRVIALGHTRRGRAEDALAAINKCIEHHPQDQIALSLRADLYRRRGDHRLAIKDYDRLLEIDPGDSKSTFNRGLNHCELGDFEKALLDIDLALALNPPAELAQQVREARALVVEISQNAAR